MSFLPRYLYCLEIQAPSPGPNFEMDREPGVGEAAAEFLPGSYSALVKQILKGMSKNFF